MGRHQSIYQQHSKLDRSTSFYLATMPYMGLSCYEYLATVQLEYCTPIEALTGQTPDISALLSFHFWEPAYYLDLTDEEFPSTTKEKSGRFAGIAESVGDAMTYKILADDTKQVLYQSTVHSALVPSECNLHLPHLEDDDSSAPQVIRSRVPLKGEKLQGEHPSISPMHTIAPDELIGRSILLPPNEEGERYRAKIVQKIIEHGNTIEGHPDKVQFMVNIDKDGAEEIYAYGDIVDFINQQNLEEETGEQLFRFKEIIGHQGPLKKGDKGWNHSMWNVMIAWEDGSQTYEPLDMIAKDSPVICARYAKDKVS